MKRHNHTASWDRRFEQLANFFIESTKAATEIVVVVVGKVTRFRIQRKRRKSAGKHEHSDIEIFRMPAALDPKMFQLRKICIDRMEQPERTDIARAEICLRLPLLFSLTGKRQSLCRKKLNQPANHHKQILARFKA